ncbi:ATP-grasp fold amidoligase family protein [Parabacteroides sp.]|uniref:ATP-grasp fold amidoligase family protein n=1 Tax=Parabacteroides sp. TaxID=1869337 RepID=UPI00257F5402|nr:ATP-grasp fold amidoligase family protein [Parabacteroides sp.]
MIRRLLNAALYRMRKILPAKLYLSLKYYLIFGDRIHWEDPKGFNEKLNWMKINYRNPQFTMMADKYRVKGYVERLIGAEYVVPCYGSWRSLDEIDFTRLPDRFFLKSNHDSGGGVLVDQGKGIDFKALQRRFNARTLRGNYYWHLREWPYKRIKPLILAEEYLDEGTGHELHDYKFLCFNGKPVYMYVTNKGAVIRENFYDMDFQPVDISHGYERTIPEYDIPKNFEKMKELAALLSRDLPFVRIDFFNVNGHLYFGEFTVYDWGGMRPLQGDWERKLGDLIRLPIK